MIEMLKKNIILESGLGAIVLIGVSLRLSAVIGNEVVLPIGLAVLALFYVARVFLSAKYHFTLAEASRISPASHTLVTFTAYLTASIALLGILFKLMFWEGSAQMLKVAIYTFLIAILGILFQMRLTASPEVFEHYRQMLVRSLVIGSFTFLIFLTPEKKMVKMVFKNNPAKAQELIKEIERREPPKKKR
jgi:hypothetical protein